MITNTQLQIQNLQSRASLGYNSVNIWKYIQSFDVAFNNAVERFHRNENYHPWREFERAIFQELLMPHYCGGRKGEILVSEFESAFLRFHIVNEVLLSNKSVR